MACFDRSSDLDLNSCLDLSLEHRQKDGGTQAAEAVTSSQMATKGYESTEKGAFFHKSDNHSPMLLTGEFSDGNFNEFYSDLTTQNRQKYCITAKWKEQFPFQEIIR